MARYRVVVADNFHYMDEDEWWTYGTFATPDEAIAAAKRIVDQCLDEYPPESSASDRYTHYQMFGDDPFIVVEDDGKSPGEPVKFSAWDYAREKCEELARSGSRIDAAPPTAGSNT